MEGRYGRQGGVYKGCGAMAVAQVAGDDGWFDGQFAKRYSPHLRTARTDSRNESSGPKFRRCQKRWKTRFTEFLNWHEGKGPRGLSRGRVRAAGNMPGTFFEIRSTAFAISRHNLAWAQIFAKAAVPFSVSGKKLAETLMLTESMRRGPRRFDSKFGREDED